MKNLSQIALRASIIIGAALLTTAHTQAALATYSSRSTFNSVGSIDQNSNFDDFGSGFSKPGDGFTRGDVTYVSAQNLVVGPSTGYAPVKNVMANNFWNPLQGSINGTPKYDMFGFDLGTFGGSPVAIQLFTSGGQIITDVNAYGVEHVQIPDYANGFAFEGFSLTGGEYFTGFSITSDWGNVGYLPGITDVTLGHVHTQGDTHPGGPGNGVPESFGTMFGLLIAGLALSGLAKFDVLKLPTVKS